MTTPERYTQLQDQAEALAEDFTRYVFGGRTDLAKANLDALAGILRDLERTPNSQGIFLAQRQVTPRQDTLLNEIRRLLENYTLTERVDLFNLVTHGYCDGCGTHSSDCVCGKCWQDEITPCDVTITQP